MSVVLNRCAPDEPTVRCQGCGLRNATCRLESCPDVDDVDPADLFVCDQCVAELKGQICGGTVTPGGRGGKVGRRHPDQAKRAAARVQAGTQQAVLLALVALRTPDDLLSDPIDGITCHDAAPIVTLMLGRPTSAAVSANQIATRMGELEEMQLVEPLVDVGVAVLRPTTPGNEGQVWVCTLAGRTEAARLAR